MYSDFVFLDRFLFELSCKHTHTHTHTHKDSNEYPIVAFSKNATIINVPMISTNHNTCRRVLKNITVSGNMNTLSNQGPDSKRLDTTASGWPVQGSGRHTSGKGKVVL